MNKYKFNALLKHPGYNFGGGDSAPAQTTTVTSNVPEYAQPYFERLLGQTEAVTGAANPYTAYAGLGAVDNRVAGQTAMQQQANLGVQGLYNQGASAAGQAGQGALAGAIQGLQGYQYMPSTANYMSVAGPAVQNYQMQGPQAIGPQLSAADPATIGQFMSPYQQQVVDVEKMAAARDYQIAQQSRNASAVKAGAFGGSRQAVADAEAQRGLMSQLQGIQAKGSQEAFTQAQQSLQAQRAAELQAAQANQQAGLATGQQNLQAQLATQQLGTQSGMQAALANQQAFQQALAQQEASQQFGASTGLQALQQQGALGQALGAMGSQEQQDSLERMRALYGAGQQQQQLSQQQINNAYQQYLDQLNYPYKQLGFMSDILHGTQGVGSASQVYQSPPSAASQLASLGLGAYGMSSLFGGTGGARAKGGRIKKPNAVKKGKINPNMGMGLAQAGLFKALKG